MTNYKPNVLQIVTKKSETRQLYNF